MTAQLLCKRFADELGYRSALAWPIRSKDNGGRVFYQMITAPITRKRQSSCIGPTIKQ